MAERSKQIDPGKAVKPQSRGEMARLVLFVGLGALVAVFAVLNLDEVEVNWILGTWSTPLILVILIALLVGAVLGYAARGSRKKKAE